jgi:hypothetical protein
MTEREEDDAGWWLISVLAAVVLGWWLAMKTMARQLATAVTTGLPAAVESPKSEDARPAVRLEKRAEDYLTVKELERYLPLCGKSIRKEIKEGKLPSHRLRGKVTVKGSDALAWLSARKEG